MTPEVQTIAIPVSMISGAAVLLIKVLGSSLSRYNNLNVGHQNALNTSLNAQQALMMNQNELIKHLSADLEVQSDELRKMKEAMKALAPLLKRALEVSDLDREGYMKWPKSNETP